MQVKTLMTGRAVCVDETETVAAAARLMSRYNVGALPVCSGGRLEGIVTDRDVALRCVAAGLDPNNTRIRAVMTAGAVTVGAEKDAAEAARLMAQRRIRRLPVEEHGAVVGMLSLGDLAAHPDCSTETAEAFADICGENKPN